MNINYINKNYQLEKLVEEINTINEVALDLEFDKNRYRYGFNLCLLQVSVNNNCYLVDPLSKDLEINKIFPVLENSEIQKVVFAFGEDLRLLHSLGCFPKNIYDINIATSLLNYPAGSLSSKILEFLDIETGKSSQNSNWFKRPLTDQQKRYAAEDVHHLISLKKIIEKKTVENSISEWVKQENDVFNYISYAEETHINYIKEKDKKGLSEVEWYVFKNLMEFREKVAEQYNKPGYQTIDKDFLKELSQNKIEVKLIEPIKGIYRSINTPKFRSKLIHLKNNLEKEALEKNLSQTKKASYLSSEEFSKIKKKKNRIKLYKNKVFKPIQKQIAKAYGENTATFILSNRLMQEIISDKTEYFPNYKKELIEKFAEELSLDISPFFNS